ncbi:uncharacterized protein LOC135806334 [Sycon ciliatum]|uniref:uncharacterized protein LOC135806334 n=1 Tax=Sycon ciliatum TaxID=27933 RepID=UPI0020ACA096|eukprot:scpid34190/ scgid22120/ 
MFQYHGDNTHGVRRSSHEEGAELEDFAFLRSRVATAENASALQMLQRTMQGRSPAFLQAPTGAATGGAHGSRMSGAANLRSSGRTAAAATASRPNVAVAGIVEESQQSRNAATVGLAQSFFSPPNSSLAQLLPSSHAATTATANPGLSASLFPVAGVGLDENSLHPEAAETLAAEDSQGSDNNALSPNSVNEQLEVLATEVRNRPFLWETTDEDRKVPYVNRRSAKEAGWQEIGERTGLSVDECRKRFKNLRDRYVKALKEHSKSGLEPKWRFYRKLDFLKGTVRKIYRQDFESTIDSENLVQTLVALNPGVASPGMASAATGQPSANSSIMMSSEPVMTQTGSSISKNNSHTPTGRAQKRVLPSQAGQQAKRVQLSYAGQSSPSLNSGVQRSASNTIDLTQSRFHGDDIDLFTANVASQMRLLSPQAVDLAKVRIQQALYDVKYQQQPKRTDTPLSSSPSNNTSAASDSNPACNE